MAKLRAVAIATLTLLVALLIISNFAPSVKADTATSLILSITPSTYEHSSASQSPAVGTLQITLSAGGTPLAGRSITIYYRTTGTTSWTFFATLPADSFGQISTTSFCVEAITGTGGMGGASGTYEFKAEYTPSGGDVGAYAACTSNIATVTLTPHVLEATAVTISITPSTVEHSSASQPIAMQNLLFTLSVGGNPLAGKSIELSWRPVGGSSWTSIGSAPTDSSGRFSTSSFATQAFASDPGTYEFKAVYTPSVGVDDTDYLGSEATCTVTLNPHTLEATATTISFTPSTIPQHTGTGSYNTQTMQVTLSAGGTPLPSKGVTISWRLVGSSSWNIIGTAPMDASGQFTTSVSVESLVTNPGTYEFKAAYIPSAGVDDTDYTGSEATCTVTLTEVVTDQSTITINSHQGSGSHISTSGVSVTTTDTSLPNGYPLQFTSIKYGTTVPSTTTSLSVSGNLYYDVQILPPSGTLGSDVMVTVQITDPSFVSASTVSYWTGFAWQSIPCSFIAPNTVSFTIEASKLSGTEFAVHQDFIVVTPEYPLGAILAVAACLFAVAVFKTAKKPTLHSFPFS